MNSKIELTITRLDADRLNALMTIHEILYGDIDVNGDMADRELLFGEYLPKAIATLFQALGLKSYEMYDMTGCHDFWCISDQYWIGAFRDMVVCAMEVQHLGPELKPDQTVQGVVGRVEALLKQRAARKAQEAEADGQPAD